MESPVSSDSIIWWLAHLINQISLFLFPIIILIASVVWFIKTKSKLSIIGVLGALLTFGALISHHVIEEVFSYNSASYMFPSETNPLIWFIFIYGSSIGPFVFSTALFFQFITKNRAKII